jgi:hypothetical protein
MDLYTGLNRRPLPTRVVRMSKKHMGVWLIGVTKKMQFLRPSWALPNDSKHNVASFTTISTDLLRLRVAQTPRSRDLAIFLLMTDGQTDRLLYPLLRMRAG